jgi:flagellar basal-body rod modification protein FlgD
MTDVASVTATAAASGAQATNAAEQTLDKDAFLRLLITQIRYQDPLSPMEDREFIAQLAQFSTLEQMQQMNTGFAAFQLMSLTTQALALVGRQVTAQVPGETEPLTGTVEAVTFAQGRPLLLMGEREIELGYVTQVR